MEGSVPMTITDYTFPSRDLGVIVCVWKIYLYLSWLHVYLSNLHIFLHQIHVYLS